MTNTNIEKKEREKMNTLKQITNDVFNVDITSKNRQREYVNARITFSSILRNEGIKYTRIGGYLGKDHATILHYITNLESYLKTDEDFREKYDTVVNEYDNKEESVYDIPDDELISEIFRLRRLNKSLYLENNALKREAKKLEVYPERMKNIHRLVQERTRVGTEKKIEIKLNHFYNGVYIR